MASKTTVLKVTGMSCNHCVNRVKKAAAGLPGVTQVDVDLTAGTATVQHDPELATVEALKAAIEDQGYDVAV